MNMTFIKLRKKFILNINIDFGLFQVQPGLDSHFYQNVEEHVMEEAHNIEYGENLEENDMTAEHNSENETKHYLDYAQIYDINTEFRVSLNLSNLDHSTHSVVSLILYVQSAI